MLTAENRNTVHINASNFWAGSINSDAKALFKSALSLSEVNKHQLERQKAMLNWSRLLISRILDNNLFS